VNIEPHNVRVNRLPGIKTQHNRSAAEIKGDSDIEERPNSKTFFGNKESQRDSIRIATGETCGTQETGSNSSMKFGVQVQQT
jgi:hypothetical protein